MTSKEQAEMLLGILRKLMRKAEHPDNGALIIPASSIPDSMLHNYSLVIRKLTFLEIEGVVVPIFDNGSCIGWRIKDERTVYNYLTVTK